MRRTIPTLVASAALVLGVIPGAFAAVADNGDCEGDTPAPTCAPPPDECLPYIEPLQAQVAMIYDWYRNVYTINLAMVDEDAVQRARIARQREVIEVLRWAVRQDDRRIDRLVRIKHRQARQIRLLRQQLAEAG